MGQGMEREAGLTLCLSCLSGRLVLPARIPDPLRTLPTLVPVCLFSGATSACATSASTAEAVGTAVGNAVVRVSACVCKGR